MVWAASTVRPRYSARSTRRPPRVAGTTPAYSSGLPRAIRAASTAAPVASVLRAGPVPRTPRTLATATAVLRELAAIPDRGWAVDREEGNIGVSCVAAP